MHTLILFVASFGQLPPALPDLPQAVAFNLRACPASCTCDNCQCEHCNGECDRKPSHYLLREQMLERIRARDAKERVVTEQSPKMPETYEKQAFQVVTDCHNGMCQLPAARPKPVYIPKPQVYYLPRYSSGGCANGNCSPPRRGWFGRR